ncbi:hypothetical protein H7Y40_01320 [Pedobacter sp.]|nr:hypothetical protein [Candidatus Saccharibacteria bacterium]
MSMSSEMQPYFAEDESSQELVNTRNEFEINLDRAIAGTLEEAGQFAAGVHVAAAEQVQDVTSAILRQRDDIEEQHAARERRANAVLLNEKRVAVAEMNERVAAAQKAYRVAQLTAGEGRDRAVSSIDVVETQATLFFAACRKSAERIYIGQELQRTVYETLIENIASAREEITSKDIGIRRIQSTIATNDTQIATNNGLIGAYTGSINANNQEQVNLHSDESARIQTAVDKKSSAMQDIEPATDADAINAQMSELYADYGDGADLLFTTISQVTLNRLNELQDLVRDHTAARKELHEQNDQLTRNTEELTAVWNTSVQRREELYRYIDELSSLKEQLLDEVAQLRDQAKILGVITIGGIERLDAVPYDLKEVWSAALDLMSLRENSNKSRPQDGANIDLGADALSIRIGDTENIAERMPVPKQEFVCAVNEGDSIIEARAVLSGITQTFGLPPAFRDVFGKVAKEIEAAPGALSRGMRLQIDRINSEQVEQA